jgi:hypothetical protein
MQLCAKQASGRRSDGEPAPSLVPWSIDSLLARLLLIPTLGGIASLHGQPSPIATDRPAITNSSVVVPSGSLQIENGFQVATASGQRTFDGPESLVVYGLTDATELRFTVPDYNFSALASGFGDLALGVKQQIGHSQSGFDASLILFVSFPTGANAESSHGYDPGLQLPWSQKLSENWTAAGMLSLYWLTQSGARNLTGESTFLFDRQLTGPWDAFVEYAGDFPERGGPRNLLHFGTAYKLGPLHQIDFHVGAGLSRAAVDHFIGVGYSFRFQARK